MAIVDERGRIFGRWNLFDLAVFVVVIGLIPLSYAAYALFRDQPPTLVSVSPAHVQESPEFHLTVKGTNLRPYMRVSVGVQQARDFIFKNTEEAELPFAYLAPGTYDVVLFDSAQERFRLKNALTVTPSSLPSTQIIAIGAFGNLDAAAAAKLTAGTALPGVGQILEVGHPVADRTDIFSSGKVIGVPVRDALRLPAVVKLTCYIRSQGGTPYCVAGDVTVAAKALMTLQTPAGSVPFQVQRVRSTQPEVAAEVTVRFTGAPSVLDRIKAGDSDNGGGDGELGVLARVESATHAGGAVEAKLRASVQQADGGWLYDSAPLRLGAPFVLRTGAYEVAGTVIGINPPR